MKEINTISSKIKKTGVGSINLWNGKHIRFDNNRISKILKCVKEERRRCLLLNNELKYINADINNMTNQINDIHIQAYRIQWLDSTPIKRQALQVSWPYKEIFRSNL
jgi:hypothetical protein